MSTCRSCDAEVRFVKSEKTGRAMILNAKPAKGVIVGHFTEIGGDPMLVDGYLGEADSPNATAVVVDVYSDHHVTCNRAADWKGRTRADPPA